MLGPYEREEKYDGASKRRQTDRRIDPFALLKREHEVIQEQLRMIESIIDSHGSGPRVTRTRNGVMTEPDRHTLREILRFFTGQVGVHFKREAVLVSVLNHVPGRKRDEYERFKSLLIEHRALKADAAGIAKALTRENVYRSDPAAADPFGLRAFIRHFRGHLSYEERIFFVLAERRLTVEQKQQVSYHMLQV